MTTFTLTGTNTGVSCGSTGSACICSPISRNPVQSVDVTLSEIKSPRPQRGDFLSATPYKTTIYEFTPVIGEYSIVQRSLQFSNSIHVRDCGYSRAGNTYTYTGNTGLYIQPEIAILPAWGENMDAAVGIAKTKALASLSASLMNVPLLIAERKQTFQTIRQHGDVLSKSIVDAYRSAMVRWKKPMSAKARRQLASDIANEHLAVLFGLLPLIDEVKGAIDMYIGLSPPIVTARGRQAFVNADEVMTPDFPAFPLAKKHWSRPWFNHTRRSYTRESARVSLTVSVGSQELQRLRDVGFNPFAASFDLIPLSFLVGFVSNLDVWVRSLDPTPDLEWIRGSQTTWRECVESVSSEMYNTAHIAPDGSGWSQSGSASGEGFSRILEVDRLRLDTFPDRSLHLYNNLSWAKAVTGVALAVQRYYKPLKNIRVPKQFRYKGPRPKYLPKIKYTKY